MNERYEQLMAQAWIEFAPDAKAVTKRFAELIVRECVTSIEKTIDTTCDTDSEKMGCEFAITDILEHFGVEE
jgi:hypothetical protein